jgi:hypothetical protein
MKSLLDIILSDVKLVCLIEKNFVDLPNQIQEIWKHEKQKQQQEQQQEHYKKFRLSLDCFPKLSELSQPFRGVEKYKDYDDYWAFKYFNDGVNYTYCMEMNSKYCIMKSKQKRDFWSSMNINVVMCQIEIFLNYKYYKYYKYYKTAHHFKFRL